MSHKAPQPHGDRDTTTSLRGPPRRRGGVLAISPYPEDHASLRGIFLHSNWVLHSAKKPAEAFAILQKNDVAVVLCECSFPDGNRWKDVLDQIRRMRVSPPVIVISRFADECLWEEVLESGAYDLLMKPFDPAELFRVVSLAWLSWKNKWKRSMEPRKFPASALRAQRVSGKVDSDS